MAEPFDTRLLDERANPFVLEGEFGALANTQLGVRRARFAIDATSNWTVLSRFS
jgi:hypothetical protein